VYDINFLKSASFNYFQREDLHQRPNQASKQIKVRKCFEVCSFFRIFAKEKKT
jgi:hypothetical protein